MVTPAEYQTWPREWYPGKFGAVRCFLSSGSQVATSPWTARNSVYGPHRQFWRFELQLNPFDDGSWKAVAAFFDEAGGQAGLIRICDPSRRWSQFDDDVEFNSDPWSDGTFFSDSTGWAEGGLPSAVFIDEQRDTRQTNVLFGGFPANVNRALRRGDVFEIQRGGVVDGTPSFHEVIRDMHTNANGAGRVYFRPALRKGVYIGDRVVLDHPMALVRCLDDVQGMIDVAPPSRGTTGFTLIEAIF